MNRFPYMTGAGSQIGFPGFLMRIVSSRRESLPHEEKIVSLHI